MVQRRINLSFVFERPTRQIHYIRLIEELLGDWRGSG